MVFEGVKLTGAQRWIEQGLQSGKRQESASAKREASHSCKGGMMTNAREYFQSWNVSMLKKSLALLSISEYLTVTSLVSRKP